MINWFTTNLETTRNIFLWAWQLGWMNAPHTVVLLINNTTMHRGLALYYSADIHLDDILTGNPVGSTFIISNPLARVSTTVKVICRSHRVFIDNNVVFGALFGRKYNTSQIHVHGLCVVSFCCGWIPVNFTHHDDVIKWKHFPRYWPFVWGIHRSPVNSPHKGQWRGALMFSLICDWINSWVNNHKAGDLRRHHADNDVIVMIFDSGRFTFFRSTHWSWDEMAAILQTLFSNAFSCRKIAAFCFKFHWNLSPKVRLTIR